MIPTIILRIERLLQTKILIKSTICTNCLLYCEYQIFLTRFTINIDILWQIIKLKDMASYPISFQIHVIDWFTLTLDFLTLLE